MELDTTAQPPGNPVSAADISALVQQAVTAQRAQMEEAAAATIVAV